MTLFGIQVSDEDEAALGMLTGFDLDFSRHNTETSNQIRGFFTQVHLCLERIVGRWLEHDAVLEILAACPTPDQLKQAGKTRIDAKLNKHGARRYTAWAGAIRDAVGAQTVVVVGTASAGLVIPHLARQPLVLHAQRVDVATHLETMVEAYPLCQILTSMPGSPLGPLRSSSLRPSGKRFSGAAALASYARLAPTNRQSGTSIKSERVSH